MKNKVISSLIISALFFSITGIAFAREPISYTKEISVSNVVSSEKAHSVVSNLKENTILTIYGSFDCFNFVMAAKELNETNVKIFLDLSNVTSLIDRDVALFSGKRYIAGISLPEGITEIWSESFSQCSYLEKVILPQSLEKIGVSAFADCESLQKIDLPRGLKVIEHFAFIRCGTLKNIKLPNSLTDIGLGAFVLCTSLKSIEIPESVKNIGKVAFSGCKALETVKVPKDFYFVDENQNKEKFSMDMIIQIFPNCVNLKTFYHGDIKYTNSPQ